MGSHSVTFPPCPPIDSIITLMTLWGITGKIIRTYIMLITYAHLCSYIFRLTSFLSFVFL